MRELPTIESAAKASSDKIHKLWEGLGYYTRARNLQKAAQVILEKHDGKFPEEFGDILELPGIGRYTAGAISSIAFNQPMPILDGNVIRVLTRIFGIEKDPREKETNGMLWQIAEELVVLASKLEPHHEPVDQSLVPRLKKARPHPGPLPQERENRRPMVLDVNNQIGSRVQCANFSEKSTPPYFTNGNCSHLNQSLMELGALVCTPRNPQCLICPVKKLCVAFKENRTEELPNSGKRAAATARRFVAFVLQHKGKCLVRQRPEGVVNAHLWEFPNTEVNGAAVKAAEIFKAQFGFIPPELRPLPSVKHSITRYRITLESFSVALKKSPPPGIWLAHSEFDSVAFTAAHKKLASFATNSMLADR